jgi:hypothetical protein
MIEETASSAARQATIRTSRLGPSGRGQAGGCRTAMEFPDAL